jgi:hypothetical protein
MLETWVTDESLRGEPDGNSFVEIPPGERIEVYWLGKGLARIFWKVAKSNEGYGGLTVTETDLRSRAHQIQ